MIQPEALLDMLVARLRAEPETAAMEAVMLRASFDRIDDRCLWLDQHLADDHGADDIADPVREVLALVRRWIASETDAIDGLLMHADDD